MGVNAALGARHGEWNVGRWQPTLGPSAGQPCAEESTRVSRVQFPAVYNVLWSCSIQSMLPSALCRSETGWDQGPENFFAVSNLDKHLFEQQSTEYKTIGTDNCAGVTGANYKQSDTKRPRTQLPLLRSWEQKQDTPTLGSEQGNLLLIFAAVWVLTKPCLNSLSGLINFSWLRRPRTLVLSTNTFHSARTCQTYLSILQWLFSCSIS